MGLFKRKDSKNSIQSEKDEQDSFVTVNSARTSNTSLRSPGYKGSGPPASIPELPIARPPDPALDPAAYLRSIHAVRERSNIVLNKAKNNNLNHFDVDMSKFEATASYVVSIIKVNQCRRTTMLIEVALMHLPNSSEIMPQTMRISHRMAAGSISTLAADRESTSCSSPGQAALMRRSARAV
jgi:hypothetical protein